MLCVQSAVATAADAHTDSGGLHITAHLLHTVQDTSGQWCVERVMERETLSNNTEYQERLREGRIKGHHFLFLESMISLSSQNWSKIKKPVIKSVQWPERRHAHAASHITGTVFVMIGGHRPFSGRVYTE